MRYWLHLIAAGLVLTGTAAAQPLPPGSVRAR